VTATRPTAAPSATTDAKAWFRGDIDGLRAIAIVLVVAYHAGIGVFRGGFVGVDVFFVISGFLISRNLLREADSEERIGLTTFWARRIRRLVPALALVIGVTLIAGYLILPLYQLNTFGQQGAAATLYVSNMYFAVQARDYFAADISGSPFLHTWSLGVEEQFYVVWPLVFAAACAWGSRFLPGVASRSRRRVLVTAFSVTLVASFALNVVLARDGSSWAFFGLPARAWEFAVAGLLAALPVPAFLRSVPARTIAAVVGLVVLAGTTVSVSDAMAYPGFWALLPVSATVLLILAGETWGGTAAPTPVSWLLSTGPMQWLGRVSYSWYLWHWPAIVLLVIALDDDSVRVRSAAAIATLPVAYLAYRFFETPLRFAPIIARSLPRTFAFGALATVVVLAGSFAVRPDSRGGIAAAGSPNMTLEERVADVTAKYQARSADSPCNQQSNRTPEGDGYCQLGDPNGERSVLLMGDSHASQWRDVFDELARADGLKLYLRNHRCPMYPIDVIDPKAGQPEIEDCRSAQAGDQRVIDFLKPDAVVMAVWSGYNDVLVDRDGNPIAPDQIGPAWEQAADTFLSGVVDRGIRLGVILDEPTLPESATSCIVKRDSIAACERTPEEAQAKSTAASAAERRVVERLGGIPTVDMVDIICDEQRCRLEIDGVLVYADHNHLSDDFAALQKPVIADFLAQVLA